MPSKYIPKTLKTTVKERANFYCEYCYAPANFSPSYFEIDHIFPSSLGGKTVAENLAFACGTCNTAKSNKLQYLDPFTNQLANLFHPRKNLWTDYFQWNENGMLIIGLNPTARATVLLLQVNRSSNINLRKLLFKEGWHPPKNYPKD